MNVNGINNASVQKILAQPVYRQLSSGAPAADRAADKVELSGVDHYMSLLKGNSDVRADKVADIKAQIAAGTYESGDKLDAAIDRLLDDLAR